MFEVAASVIAEDISILGRFVVSLLSEEVTLTVTKSFYRNWHCVVAGTLEQHRVVLDTRSFGVVQPHDDHVETDLKTGVQRMNLEHQVFPG